jgi:Tfp pilus assembly protein PilF
MYPRLWPCKIAGSVLLFLLASVLYINGLCPTMYWNDSPEFVTTAHTLGISHPAGSPTYSLFAKLVTFLPIGSVALRVNAFSALVGACSIALLFSLLYELLSTSSAWIRGTAAAGGALFLLVSESFWRFAEVAEVYMLQNYFLVLLLALLLKARMHTPSGQRYSYWLFAFLYGLSAGVHATMALFVPALLGFIGLTAPRMLKGKALAFLAFFFLLGFATYLYLPIRSLTEPAFNWGDPQTFQQFLTHISDRKDAKAHTVLFWRQLPYQIYMYTVHISNEFAVFGVALGLLGYVAIFRKDKPLWFLLSAAWLGHTAFFIRTWWEAGWGFIPSFVIFALCIGYGLHTCLTYVVTLYQRHHIRIPRVAFYTFLWGSLAVTLEQSFIRHFPVVNQAANYSTELYGKLLLAQLPPEAILFCEYSWFPMLYLQQVEHQRPDLSFILQGEVFSPSHFTLVSTKRLPNIQQVTSDTPITVSTVNYFWLLAQLNAKEHPLFWDPDAQYQQDFSEYLLPQGLLFTFRPGPQQAMTPADLRRHWQLLPRSTNRVLQGDLEDSTTEFLAHKLNIIAAHFRRLGAFAEATKMYQAALSMRANDTGTHNNYGALLMSQGELSKAMDHFLVAYSQNPLSALINKNIGLLMSRIGDSAQAAYFLERAVDFGHHEGDVYVRLGQAYTQLGHLSSALYALQTALQYYQKQVPENVLNENLPAKVSWVQERIDRLETQLQAGSQTR